MSGRNKDDDDNISGAINILPWLIIVCLQTFFFLRFLFFVERESDREVGEKKNAFVFFFLS